MAVSEDAVPTRTDQAADDDQHNPEDDLALEELNDANDDQDRGDDPQDGCTHLGFLFLPNGTWECPIWPVDLTRRDSVCRRCVGKVRHTDNGTAS